MCQEHLQKETQLLTSRLEEGRLHIPNVLFPWEVWSTVRATNLTFYHALELT